MTPWPLEFSTNLPPKTSTALVLISSAFVLIQSLVQMPLPLSLAIVSDSGPIWVFIPGSFPDT